MSIPINLEGRVILVCGVGKGGIGGPTARIIAEAGAAVVALDKTRELLDPTLADIESAGGRCHGIVADLMDPDQTDPIVASAIARFGRLDGVANVAGGTRAEEWMRLEETPLDSFHATVNLNFEYSFRICRDVARHMIASKTPGSLVNVGSISSLSSAPYHGPYGAAKAAMAALTRTMAIEWQPYGIRTNTVHPGSVRTARTMAFQSDGADVPKVISTTPEAIGHTIAFLLSDLACGISGQNIYVDSGLGSSFCSGAISLDNLPKKS
jgi:NAD(P)-dependent dehydrogenase (short-subunit alcohol dehydrogenase family)